VIQNDLLEQQFHCWLQIMLERRGSSGNSTFNTSFTSNNFKEKVLRRISKSFKRVSGDGRVKVLQTWIGVSPGVIPILCKTGPADLRLTDTGYFGAGIYSTLQASYAIKYSTGDPLVANTPVPPNENGEHTLLLCWIGVGNVYPITQQDDYTKKGFYSDFFGKSNGLALKPGFDAHCVTVSTTSGYQACQDPDDPNERCFDEIVVKESQQVLPQFVVYFKY